MPKKNKNVSDDNLNTNLQEILKNYSITIPDVINKSDEFDNQFSKLTEAYISVAKMKSDIEKVLDKISDEMTKLDKMNEDFKLNNKTEVVNDLSSTDSEDEVLESSKKPEKVTKKATPKVKKATPKEKKTAPKEKKTAPKVKKTAPKEKKTAPKEKKTAPKVTSKTNKKKIIESDSDDSD